MKALVCDRFGSLDDVRFRDVEDPIPGPDDVLVRVRASGAVFTDVLFAKGQYQVKPPLPFVLGSEVAGDVIAAGKNVSRLKEGDRIMSLAINFGGFAEKVVLPSWLPSHLPQEVSYETGAAVMASAATAQHALRQRAAIRKGETLVVTGAAGGTGSAAVQVGKLLGAKVIAVCSTAKRADFCRSLGADDAIVCENEDLKQGLRQRTDGIGADVVFDTVGGDAFGACARSMAHGGRLLVVGFASGHIPVLPVNLTLVRGYAVIGIHWLTFVKQHPEMHIRNMDELTQWLIQGLLTPHIDAVMPLADGVQALQRIANRDVMGKIVLRM